MLKFNKKSHHGLLVRDKGVHISYYWITNNGTYQSQIFIKKFNDWSSVMRISKEQYEINKRYKR